jgi:hypothetical protein
VGKADVNKLIILKRILKKQNGRVVDWIHLVKDRDQWWALVNMVMNFRFP